jgi:hypothetical protein
MTLFNTREQDFENRFVHDEEMKFKFSARRNRLLGIWAAGRLGLTGRTADDYTYDLVECALHPEGLVYIIDRLTADFIKAGKPLDLVQIRSAVALCESEARHQLTVAATE